jgi:hypothetical protein
MDETRMGTDSEADFYSTLVRGWLSTTSEVDWRSKRRMPIIANATPNAWPNNNGLPFATAATQIPTRNTTPKSCMNNTGITVLPLTARASRRRRISIQPLTTEIAPKRIMQPHTGPRGAPLISTSNIAVARRKHALDIKSAINSSEIVIHFVGRRTSER